MKIHLDIRHDISPTIALECVKQVIVQGKISADGKSYCYATQQFVRDVFFERQQKFEEFENGMFGNIDYKQFLMDYFKIEL